MLTQKQLEYIKITIENPEMTDLEIAEQLGLNNATLSRWKRKEEFIDELNKALRKQWGSYVKKAQKRILELVDSPRGDVALGAAKYIMSSNGYDATQKIQADVEADVNVIKVDITDD